LRPLSFSFILFVRRYWSYLEQDETVVDLIHDGGSVHAASDLAHDLIALFLRSRADQVEDLLVRRSEGLQLRVFLPDGLGIGSPALGRVAAFFARRETCGAFRAFASALQLHF